MFERTIQVFRNPWGPYLVTSQVSRNSLGRKKLVTPYFLKGRVFGEREGIDAIHKLHTVGRDFWHSGCHVLNGAVN